MYFSCIMLMCSLSVVFTVMMSCRYVLLMHHADVFTVRRLHRSRTQLSPSLTGDARDASLGETMQCRLIGNYHVLNKLEG